MRPADGDSADAGGKRPDGRPLPPAGTDDLIELGGDLRLWPWRGHRATLTAVATAALAAGLLAGFAVGHVTAGRQAPHPPAAGPASRSPRAPQDSAVAVEYTGNRCAVQRGRTLQLGIEIDNRTGRTITVRHIGSVLRPGGLRQISSQVATCGALTLPGGAPLTTILSGASAWLSVTFAVTVGCPARYPVLFVLDYAIAGKRDSVYFDGFPDLSLVPYTGCGTGSGAR